MAFRRFAGRAIGVLILALTPWVLLAIGVHAQAPPNLPPPGAYQPIPNFAGVGAGLQFRQAINDRFSGVVTSAPAVVRIAFANLPTEQGGFPVMQGKNREIPRFQATPGKTTCRNAKLSLGFRLKFPTQRNRERSKPNREICGGNREFFGDRRNSPGNYPKPNRESVELREGRLESMPAG